MNGLAFETAEEILDAEMKVTLLRSVSRFRNPFALPIAGRLDDMG